MSHEQSPQTNELEALKVVASVRENPDEFIAIIDSLNMKRILKDSIPKIYELLSDFDTTPADLQDLITQLYNQFQKSVEEGRKAEENIERKENGKFVKELRGYVKNWPTIENELNAFLDGLNEDNEGGREITAEAQDLLLSIISNTTLSPEKIIPMMREIKDDLIEEGEYFVNSYESDISASETNNKGEVEGGLNVVVEKNTAEEFPDPSEIEINPVPSKPSTNPNRRSKAKSITNDLEQDPEKWAEVHSRWKDVNSKLRYPEDYNYALRFPLLLEDVPPDRIRSKFNDFAKAYSNLQNKEIADAIKLDKLNELGFQEFVAENGKSKSNVQKTDNSNVTIASTNTVPSESNNYPVDPSQAIAPYEPSVPPPITQALGLPPLQQILQGDINAERRIAEELNTKRVQQEINETPEEEEAPVNALEGQQEPEINTGAVTANSGLRGSFRKEMQESSEGDPIIPKGDLFRFARPEEKNEQAVPGTGTDEVETPTMAGISAEAIPETVPTADQVATETPDSSDVVFDPKPLMNILEQNTPGSSPEVDESESVLEFTVSNEIHKLHNLGIIIDPEEWNDYSNEDKLRVISKAEYKSIVNYKHAYTEYFAHKRELQAKLGPIAFLNYDFDKEFYVKHALSIFKSIQLMKTKYSNDGNLSMRDIYSVVADIRQFEDEVHLETNDNYRGKRFLGGLFNVVKSAAHDVVGRVRGVVDPYVETMTNHDRYKKISAWARGNNEAISKASHVIMRIGVPMTAIMASSAGVVAASAAVGASLGTAKLASIVENEYNKIQKKKYNKAGHESLEGADINDLLETANMLIKKAEQSERNKKIFRWAKSAAAITAGIATGGWASSFMTGHEQAISALQDSISDKVGDMAQEARQGIHNFAQSGSEFVQDAAEKASGTANAVSGAVVDSVKEAYHVLPENLRNDLSVAGDKLSENIGVIGDNISATATNMYDSLPENIRDGVESAGERISNGIRSFMDWLSPQTPATPIVEQAVPNAEIVPPQSVLPPDVSASLEGIMTEVQPGQGFTQSLDSLFDNTSAKLLPDWMNHWADAHGVPLSNGGLDMSPENFKAFAIDIGAIDSQGNSIIMQPGDSIGFDAKNQLVITRDGVSTAIVNSNGEQIPHWYDKFSFKK